MFKVLTSSAGASGYPEFTLATLPSASSALWSGRHILCTDLGPTGGTVLRSNGTRWRPNNGRLLLASVNAAAAVTGSTSKTALATVALPYQIMAYTGVVIESEFLWSSTNNANSKGIKVELGTTTFHSSSGVSTASCLLLQRIRLRGSASQVAVGASLPAGVGSTVNAIVTGTEDLSSAKNLVFSAQLANSGDTATLEGYTISLVLP